MTWISSIARQVLLNVISETPPNVVLAVKPEDYAHRSIYCRDDAVMIYRPGTGKNNSYYDLVLHRPCTDVQDQAYSSSGWSKCWFVVDAHALTMGQRVEATTVGQIKKKFISNWPCDCLFRSSNLDVVDVPFVVYRDKIPLLIEICPQLRSVKEVQTLCDTLMEHPTWTVAHVAAHLGLHKAFEDPTVISQLHMPDSESGSSVLQVAVQTNNLKTVEVLLAAGCDLDHMDKNLNTVFHYAATTSQKIIMALGSGRFTCLNYRNKSGYTPMHVACLNDKPECVKALLLLGVDVNIPASNGGEATSPGYVRGVLESKPDSLHPNEMKFGGTPLHWSRSQEVIFALIEANCDVETRNFDGQTALHVMVMRSRLECVSALLSHMACVNVRDNKGNTPLHLAMSTKSVPIVQMLIGFGADLDALNERMQTPRHLIDPNKNEGNTMLYLFHAVGAKRCDPGTEGCSIGCAHNETFNGVAPPEPATGESRTKLDDMLYTAGMEELSTHKKTRMKGGRLLSLDGGGIRGLVLVQVLIEIESVLGKPVVDCFDWIAGTSTGGILALGLVAGKSLKQCQALYFRMKETAFVTSRPYPSENLETILKENLGTDTVMANLRGPKIMITGVLGDRKPIDLHLFRNYRSPSELLGVPACTKFRPTLPPEEQLLWKAARATAAAPSYFRAFGRFLDGGLIANNPTLDAMTEIHEYYLAAQATGKDPDAVPLSLVVSLGTGQPPVTNVTEIDYYPPGGFFDVYRFSKACTSIFAMLVDQATASDGRVIDRAKAWCSMIGVPFFRFSPQLTDEVVMDEKDDANLAKMLWTSRAWMHANRAKIKELAALIDRD